MIVQHHAVGYAAARASPAGPPRATIGGLRGGLKRGRAEFGVPNARPPRDDRPRAAPRAEAPPAPAAPAAAAAAYQHQPLQGRYNYKQLKALPVRCRTLTSGRSTSGVASPAPRVPIVAAPSCDSPPPAACRLQTAAVRAELRLRGLPEIGMKMQMAAREPRLPPAACRRGALLAACRRGALLDARPPRLPSPPSQACSRHSWTRAAP